MRIVLIGAPELADPLAAVEGVEVVASAPDAPIGKTVGDGVRGVAPTQVLFVVADPDQAAIELSARLARAGYRVAAASQTGFVPEGVIPLQVPVSASSVLSLLDSLRAPAAEPEPTPEPIPAASEPEMVEPAPPTPTEAPPAPQEWPQVDAPTPAPAPPQPAAPEWSQPPAATPGPAWAEAATPQEQPAPTPPVAPTPAQPAAPEWAQPPSAPAWTQDQPAAPAPNPEPPSAPTWAVPNPAPAPAPQPAEPQPPVWTPPVEQPTPPAPAEPQPPVWTPPTPAPAPQPAEPQPQPQPPAWTPPVEQPAPPVPPVAPPAQPPSEPQAPAWTAPPPPQPQPAPPEWEQAPPPRAPEPQWQQPVPQPQAPQVQAAPNQPGWAQQAPSGQGMASAEQAAQSAEAFRSRMFAATAREGKVIVIAAAKGGVGKSSFGLLFSAVMAENLAETGKAVVHVDSNLVQADAARYLGRSDVATVTSLAREPLIDEGAIARVLTRLDNRPLALLAGPNRPEEAAPDILTPALMGRIVTVLREMFDYVVVDAPAADIHSPVFSKFLMPEADHLVVVVDTNKIALEATQRWLTSVCNPVHLGGADYPVEKVNVVFNRYRPNIGMEENDVREALARFKYVGRIPESDQWMRAANSGDLFSLNAKVYGSLADVALQVTGDPLIKPSRKQAQNAKKAGEHTQSVWKRIIFGKDR